jgi:hypothetical protein
VSKIVTQIETALQQREQEAQALKERSLLLNRDQQQPQPFWTPATFTSTELAQQMSLIEWDLLRRVEPCELLGRSWTYANREVKAPNLMKLIQRTNAVRGCFE